MTPDERSKIERLRRRIKALRQIQEVICSALDEPCTREERAGLEGMLQRHKLKEEQLRQELAALG